MCSSNIEIWRTNKEIIKKFQIQKSDFDVPIGCYDGAIVCEFVVIFTLNKLSIIVVKNSIGLCRVDGLGVFDKLFSPQIEQKKKNIIKTFKDSELSITLTSNNTSVDFLHISLNLKTVSYQSFRKSNSSN